MQDSVLTYGFSVYQPESVRCWEIETEQTLKAILPKAVYVATVEKGDKVEFEGHEITIQWTENDTCSFVIGFLIHIATSDHDLVTNVYLPRYGEIADILTTHKAELDAILTRLIKKWKLQKWTPTPFGLHLTRP